MPNCMGPGHTAGEHKSVGPHLLTSQLSVFVCPHTGLGWLPPGPTVFHNLGNWAQCEIWIQTKCPKKHFTVKKPQSPRCFPLLITHVDSKLKGIVM